MNPLFTPLKIYNGTPEGVPLEIQGQQLPINELNGTPLKGACPISNLHRCKIFVDRWYVLLINVSSFGQAIVELERPIDESAQ